MKFATSLVALLATATTLVAAAPAALEERDVWTPRMTYPRAGTVRKSGQRHNVTWETASRPVNITNPNGFILLRTGEIETPVLVAHNFDIRKGRVEVTVPDVMTRNDFSLVLFGDSGNWGEQFTIQGPKGF